MAKRRIYTDEELHQDGLTLLENGHRMIFIFKYIRQRAENEAQRNRVMTRLTSDQQVQSIKQERLDATAKAGGFSWIDIAMWIFLILFFIYFIVVVVSGGRIPILPILIIIAIALGLLRNKF